MRSKFKASMDHNQFRILDNSVMLITKYNNNFYKNQGLKVLTPYKRIINIILIVLKKITINYIINKIKIDHIQICLINNK